MFGWLVEASFIDDRRRYRKSEHCEVVVLAPPFHRPPFGLGLLCPSQSHEGHSFFLGLSCPGLSQEGRLGLWRTWWFSSVRLRSWSRAGLGQGPLPCRIPKGIKGRKGWVPRGDSIQEVIPVVRSSLCPCSGEYPNRTSETLGAIGSLQAHTVEHLLAQ